MREIKLRGKRVDNGEWVVGDYARYSNEKSIIMVDLLEQEDYWVSSETVGLYTGLKDRNGVEIYEGDVLIFDGEKFVILWDEVEEITLIAKCDTCGWRSYSQGADIEEATKALVLEWNGEETDE